MTWFERDAINICIYQYVPLFWQFLCLHVLSFFYILGQSTSVLLLLGNRGSLIDPTNEKSR